jgi:hypothetical protein
VALDWQEELDEEITEEPLPREEEETLNQAQVHEAVAADTSEGVVDSADI